MLFSVSNIDYRTGIRREYRIITADGQEHHNSRRNSW